MAAPDHKQKSRKVFDQQARDYDEAAVETFAFADVLDVGCGTGSTLEAIVRAHPRARAWGVDLSDAMLGVARERLGGLALLEIADAERLPFRDACMDLVTCVDSLHHYPDPAAALAEMHRVSRPGAGLVIGEWSVAAPARQLMNLLLPRLPGGDVRIYAPAELQALAEAAGYGELRCRPAGIRGQLLVARRLIASVAAAHVKPLLPPR
jgi:ubiquinone/menaquinone biosynthesis C-methylase UbiE